MKKISMFILLTGMILLGACQEDLRSDYYSSLGEENVSLNNQSQDIKDDENAVTESETEIDSLAVLYTEINTLNSQIDDLKKQVSSNSEGSLPVNGMVIVIIVLVVVSVLLIILFHFILRNTEKELYGQIKMINNKISQVRMGFDEDLRTYIDSHVTEHKKLVIQLNEALQSLQVKPEGQQRRNERRQEMEREQKRTVSKQLSTGYFGMLKSGSGITYFNDYPQSENDDAFFKMETYDGKVCSFAPFDIQRLKPLDMLEEAVEFEGCPLKDAREIVRIDRKGTADYHADGNYWQITSKAKIIIG